MDVESAEAPSQPSSATSSLVCDLGFLLSKESGRPFVQALCKATVSTSTSVGICTKYADVSSLPQWSQAVVSAIPIRVAYSLVNATANHNLHSRVASAVDISTEMTV